MDGAQFAKMLSDKHLFELNRMEYKYSTVSVKEFAELPVSYTHLQSTGEKIELQREEMFLCSPMN